MRLFKRIAPIALGAVFAFALIGAPAMGASLNNWDDNFPAASTAIVIGANAATQDETAVVDIANTLGISTSTTEYDEEYQIVKSTNNVNLGDDLQDIKTSLQDDELPGILGDGTYTDQANSDYDYTQKLSLINNALVLTHFSDSDYDNEEPTLGFNPAGNTNVLNYTLEFSTTPTFSTTNIETTDIEIMGNSYYVSDVTTDKITLLDAATTTIVTEGETGTIEGKDVEILYVGSTPEVKLKIDGETTNTLSEGASYKLSDGSYVGIKDIMYVAKDTGVSSVEVALGKGKIEIEDGNLVQINDDSVMDLYGYLTNTSGYWVSMTLRWLLDDEAFLTEGDALTFPGLETLQVMLKDFYFPGEEVVTVDGGATYIQMKVPLEKGTATIYPIWLNSTAYFIGTGKDGNNQLVTTHASTLDYNYTGGDRNFIASYNGTDNAQSYLCKVTITGDATYNYTTIYYWNGDDDEWVTSCENRRDGQECNIGDVTLTIGTIVKTATLKWVNFTGATGVTFDEVYTKGGLRIQLFQNSSSSAAGYINFTNTTHNNTATATYTLWMKEANKDDALGTGDDINLTVSRSSDNKTSITAITTDWLGTGAPFEYPSQNDVWVGYTESDLGTKVVWDKTGDEYDVDVTYAGGESYANVFIVSTVASTTTASSVAVKDSEIDDVKTKNLVVVGGSGINEVAAYLLGLDYPTYGSSDAWQTATAVDEPGKALLKIMESPYSSSKYALLVAGWEGIDTKRAAKALTTPIDGLTGESLVLSTVDEVATVLT
ncbi:MAG: hypothetical protein JSW08_02635 [archaeon]|nr:MAG: hypothetical protein JSW08_02635 [archaeon]